MSLTESHDDRESDYEDESRALMVKHGATAAIVIVIGGDRGTGFSFSAIRQDAAGLVPGVLREVANEIEGVKPS